MDEKIELYFPSAQDMDTETIDLFGARFPMVSACRPSATFLYFAPVSHVHVLAEPHD